VRLPKKIVALHDAFTSADIPHAFGGALALAWCTQQARGTIDIDVNLFIGQHHAQRVLVALPRGVRWDDPDRADLERVGQTRLWWEETPVDVFLSTTEFHERVGTHVRWEPFEGKQLPFLSCTDLAVFKAMFSRTRDWADLEDMAVAGTLDRPAVLGILVDALGTSDPRIERLRSLPRPDDELSV
jgi:hypothetical protein